MKKKLTALIAFLITALVLVGCTVTVEPMEPITGKRLDVPFAEASSPNATVNSGDAERFKAHLAPNFNEDVIVFDLRNAKPGMEMNIRNERGGQIAFTDSFIFGKNRASVQSMSGFNLDLTAVGVVGPTECVGFCIVVPKSVYANNTLIIDVDNPSNSTAELFAYGAMYWDLNEPNDNRSQAVAVDSTGDEGAFETLGDVDYWKGFPNKSGTIHIKMASGQLVPESIVYTSSGQPAAGANLIPVGTSGLEYKIVILKDEVLALSLVGDVAAAPDLSKYTISFVPDP